MFPSLRTATLVACLVAWAPSSAVGEYVLNQEEGPGLYYVHGRYKFYVSEVTDDAEPATLELKDFAIKTKDGSAAAKDSALHVVMIPIKEFTKLVKENVSMCTTNHQLSIDQGSSKTKPNMVSKEVIANQASQNAELKLKKGGAHMLMIVNCKTNAVSTVSGKVRVKSTWGYLDAVDYYKVPIYACALITAIITVLVYLFCIFSQEESIRDTQYYCLLLGLMGVAEAGGQCASLWMENEGVAGWGSAVEALYLAKLMYGLTFMVQTAQGLGFISDRLDWATTAKCYMAVLVYVLAAMPKICILAISPHLAVLNKMDVMKSTAPCIIVTCLMLCWVLCSLGSLMRELRKRDDTEALQACRRISGLFGCLMIAATMTLVGQVAASETASNTWNYAVWNDAIASATLGVFLMVMMYFSMQSYVGKSLQMGQLPTNEVDLEDDDLKGPAGAEDEEEAIFGKGPPSPAKIGAGVE